MPDVVPGGRSAAVETLGHLPAPQATAASERSRAQVEQSPDEAQQNRS